MQRLIIQFLYIYLLDLPENLKSLFTWVKNNENDNFFC